MNWKFWKKDDSEKDETTIKVTTAPGSKEIYVCAQTSEKALTLYKKLEKQK